MQTATEPPAPVAKAPVQRMEEERILLMGALFEKLIGVNGFFMTAGYGVFFGVWALVKDQMQPVYVALSCLFLLASAALFVTWHFIGMLSLSTVLVNARSRRPSAMSDARRQRLRLMLGTIELVKLPVLYVIAATAFAGLAVLFAGLVKLL